jgi:hypothetical protein
MGTKFVRVVIGLGRLPDQHLSGRATIGPAQPPGHESAKDLRNSNLNIYETQYT